MPGGALSASFGRSGADIPPSSRFNQPPEAIDEVLLAAERRHPPIGRNIQLMGYVTVFDVKLDQGFRMFRHESDGDLDYGDPVFAGAG